MASEESGTKEDGGLFSGLTVSKSEDRKDEEEQGTSTQNDTTVLQETAAKVTDDSSKETPADVAPVDVSNAVDVDASPSLETAEVQAEDTECGDVTMTNEDKPTSASDERAKRDSLLTDTTDEAFHVVTDQEVTEAKKSATKQKPAPSSSPGVIHDETPIPNSDQSLRLLRKFASKSRPLIPVSLGGTKTLGVLGYLFGSSSKEDDLSLVPFSELMDIVLEGEEIPPTVEETDIVVEAVLGGSGDSMNKARLAVASFCHLLSVWCHASQRLEGKDVTASDLLALAMDTATALVAHGCLDDVVLVLANQGTKAIHVMAESIIVTDLSNERVELATLKFLLTTGCRSTPAGEALLRGTHLLQAIRVMYHVYLTTDSESNKTTARASLQQLVTSVFKRMLITPVQSHDVDGFPSPNHRDSFLVLRSICKLSMRTLPDPGSKTQGHTGLSTSGSSVAWDGGTQESAVGSPSKQKDVETPSPEKAVAVVSVHSMHPALESKVLALELLLYVLQNTDLSGNFLQNSGPQFQYAIRNYLCVSLLKNCTAHSTAVVNLSLRLFVPLVHNFRSHLKTEIEAFVTNVFFVILDSKHSTVEHKSLVVVLFDEICSDPQTLAEIFLNYDCDLSAVDLFHRIVNTLSRVARSSVLDEATISSMSFVAGAGAARMEKMRNDNRQLRLEAMKAMRQVLASLHASIVEPMSRTKGDVNENGDQYSTPVKKSTPKKEEKNLVQIYDSKKKLRAEEAEAALRFNQKPSAGIKYSAQCGHIDASDPLEVATYLLKNKDIFDKTQIGEYLGRETAYQGGFCLKVLHEYVNLLDFTDLVFDDAIKVYLSGFRLPGEAQKIDRIMEKFAERFTLQNPGIFPTADVAFILAFSIIMLNTDLHNPAIKEDRRMTKDGFIRNNRGICDGQDLPPEMLNSIFDRIKESPISLKEDDDARAKAEETDGGGIQTALSPAVFFSSHYDEMDKDRETNFQKERDQIVKTTESLLRRKRHSTAHGKDHDGGKSPGNKRTSSHKNNRVKFVRTEDTGLRDEYVAPMFEVTWGPALAAFSTAMESANGTMGALLAIATDEELEHAAENAAETIEVCLTGFRFAICTAGLCGNETARDAYMLALSRFTQLGTGIFLEPRHVRCIQTLLSLGKEDGELLGSTWEHVFKALSEAHRYHEMFQQMARNDRAAAAAAERRRKREQELEARRMAREEREKRLEAAESTDGESDGDDLETLGSMTDDDDVFSDDEDLLFDEEMDRRETEEANARVIFEAITESLVDAIYQRSASLSGPSIKEFVYQLCRVSRMEISGYGGHAGSNANTVDLSQAHYRQQHTLLDGDGTDNPHNQPNIYNLQKLVEVTHYNMDSRPRLVFTDIWTPISAHLTSTALHSNAAVAMYAVDSFRQLSTKYLKREELGGFEFQRKFLKPFETIMAKSEHASVRELLLKCVERIIMMFGTSENGKPEQKQLGTLRSGWRPVLAVLGLAGQDSDGQIAKMGFTMLTGQLRQCLSVEKDDGGVDRPSPGVLLAERFVDLVDAFLMYVSGPHEDMSLVSIDHLVTLTTFLADKSFALPLIKKRTDHLSVGGVGADEANGELELWWPILLGLSKSMGDARNQVRLKCMVTLLGIINQHFFPEDAQSSETSDAPRQGDPQTLQLVFRGVLIPVLEHADSGAHMGPSPSLPDDFERFLTKPSEPLPKENRNVTWLETTFEHFMDGCIAICMRSIEVFKEDSLVEEIFAMLNSCLLSDSGGLAVRGLRRLEQFVTKDLDASVVNDEIWATVCHMLRRCLSVRGLPHQKPAKSSQVNGAANQSLVEDDSSVEGKSEMEAKEEEENDETVREFVAEEKIMQDRRYIGSNVAKIICAFLSTPDQADSMGSRWRLFLTAGLGRGIKEWEEAGSLLATYSSDTAVPSPPNYIENAIYGRRLMNKLVLQLIELNQSGSTPAVQSLIKEQTESLLALFLAKEEALNKPNGTGATKSPSWEAAQLTRVTKLIFELINSFENLSDPVLAQLAWLSPMLTSCMESSNESVRRNVHKLQQRMTKSLGGEKGSPEAPTAKE